MHPEAMAETFLDVEDLLKSIANRFSMATGIDFDDLFSEAQLHFIHAYDTWNWKGKACFSTWCYRKVWDGLGHYVKAQKNKRHKSLESIDAEAIEEARVGDFNLMDFVELMGFDFEEAVIIAIVVCETPREIETFARLRGGNPRNWKSAIREYLKDVGWQTWEINRSFEELKRLL